MDKLDWISSGAPSIISGVAKIVPPILHRITPKPGAPVEHRLRAIRRVPFLRLQSRFNFSFENVSVDYFYFVACFGKAFFYVFGNHHGAVLATSAAKANCQVTLPFTDVMGNQINQQFRDTIDKFLRLGKRTNVFGYLRMAPSKRPELGNKVRVGKKAHIEEQINIVRNAGLVTEADAGNQDILVSFAGRELIGNVGAQLVDIEA